MSSEFGRPREYKARTSFLFNCEIALLEEFKKITKREHRAMSRVLQELMLDYVKKHGNGNPNFQITKWQGRPDLKAMPTIGEAINLTGYSDEEVTEIREALRQRITEVDLAHTKTFEGIEEAYIKGDSRLSEEAFKSTHGLTKTEFYEIRKQRRKVAKQ